MLITDKLTEFSIGRANKRLEEMKENNLEDYDKTKDMILLATEVATHFLKESEDFRKAFAKIHAQFLRYPESREIIEESIVAYQNFEADKLV